jgi:hypothetical protein
VSYLTIDEKIHEPDESCSKIDKIHFYSGADLDQERCHCGQQKQSGPIERLAARDCFAAARNDGLKPTVQPDRNLR